MIGLDSSGKTTTFYKMKDESSEVVTNIPTIGFNVETIKDFYGYEINSWDIGGSDKIKVLRDAYYERNMKGIIFVIDSGDRQRDKEAERELHFTLGRLREKYEFNNLKLLVLANKQDLVEAMTVDEVIELLSLNDLEIDWNCFPCCAVKGEGLLEAFEWFYSVL
eukprot:TRINITY_DN1457_c1_g2_i2.p1 TRINITY_DN1457_c1_g2~~TRINITY_DN1457_c1_g2_i2.p1  ORF type:complete len:164 (+),score=38.65 TRINITY_DN1457_c1_g2_i2:201-692(+)